MATNTVTTEQVREAIEQFAAMVVAASVSPQTVANILEMLRNLNDQEKIKVSEIAEAYIQRILNTGLEAEKVSYGESNVEEALNIRPTKQTTPELINDSHADISFSDDNGNIVFEVSNGHLRSKKFSSENIKKPSITTIDNENFLIFI